MFKVRRQRVFYISNPNNVTTVDTKAAIAITEVTFDNVGRVVDFRSEGYARAFHRFLEEGQYGVYAWLESKVVGHAWAKICGSCHCRVNGYMDIRQNEALIHFCNVREDQRGQNIYPAMLAILCQRLFAEANVSRVLIDTELDNKASLRGIVKAGFNPLGTGLYVQFLGHLIFKHFVPWDGEMRCNNWQENTEVILEDGEVEQV